MSAKRIDAVYIIGDIFIEGDIVKVTFDFKHAKNKEGRICGITNEFLYIDNSEHFRSNIYKINMDSIAAIVKID